MRKDWHEKAGADYHWQTQDRKTIQRINILIKSIERGSGGIGKPELLKGDLSGWSAVRIDQANRLIYRLHGDILQILSARGHYT